MYVCSLSSSLELPGRWARVRQDPLYRHTLYPRRIILSDQHSWTFTCSTISYEVPPWFLLLGRIVNKRWDLSPMRAPKFFLRYFCIFISSVYVCSLSSSLELPGRRARVRQDPLYRHTLYPRRIILSDQHSWTFTCSTISYEVPPWFLLLGRIVNKIWDLSPMRAPKFLLPHRNTYRNILYDNL